MQKESDPTSSDDDVLDIFKLMLNTFYEKHDLAENPMESIRKVSCRSGHVATGYFSLAILIMYFLFYATCSVDIHFIKIILFYPLI